MRVKSTSAVITEGGKPYWNKRTENLSTAMAQLQGARVFVPYKSSIILHALMHLDANRGRACRSETRAERDYWDLCHTIAQKIIYSAMMKAKEIEDKKAKGARA